MNLELLLSWPECSCTSSTSRVILCVLSRTSSCPIQDLLSKFCFCIKAEAAIFRHYSENTRSRQECNIIVLFLALMVVSIKKLLNFIMQQKNSTFPCYYIICFETSSAEFTIFSCPSRFDFSLTSLPIKRKTKITTEHECYIN